MDIYRLGFDAFVARKSIVRKHMPDHWPKHRIPCFLYRISGPEQRVVFVSAWVVHLILGVDEHWICRLKWGIPRLLLSTYMQFCAVLSFVVTVWLLFVKEVMFRCFETVCAFVTKNITG